MTRQQGHEVLAELVRERAMYVAWARKRLPNRDDAEDVVQQALVRATSKVEQLRDVEAAQGWFWQILRRALSDHLSSRDRRRERSERLMALELAEPSVALHPIDETVCRCSMDELDHLPETLKKVLWRVDVEDGSFAEVADELGITPNAARVRAHRARQQMRERLDARCGTHDVSSCMSCDC